MLLHGIKLTPQKCWSLSNHKHCFHKVGRWGTADKIHQLWPSFWEAPPLYPNPNGSLCTTSLKPYSDLYANNVCRKQETNLVASANRLAQSLTRLHDATCQFVPIAQKVLLTNINIKIYIVWRISEWFNAHRTWLVAEKQAGLRPWLDCTVVASLLVQGGTLNPKPGHGIFSNKSNSMYPAFPAVKVGF